MARNTSMAGLLAMALGLGSGFPSHARELPRPRPSAPYVPTKYRHSKQRKSQIPNGYWIQVTPIAHMHAHARRRALAALKQ